MIDKNKTKIITNDRKEEQNKVDYNPLILMLGIMNGKLDDIIRLLTDIKKETKKSVSTVKTSNDSQSN